MKTKFKWLAVVLIVAFVAAGCAARFVTVAATSVGAAADIYDMGMETVSELQAAGYITDEQREEINGVAGIVYHAIIVADHALVAYNNAVLAYEESKAKDDKVEVAVKKAALIAALDFMDSSWADLAKLVNSIKPDTLPEEL